MTKPQRDIWSEWLLHRRFGGNAEQMKTAMEYLYRVRDRVLEHASLKNGEAMQEALSPAERDAFTAYLRPLVEAGQGGSRSAVAYLWAVK